MNWFRNLKRWQKGGIIGLVIGIILGLFVSPLVSWIPIAPLISYLIIVTHFIPAYFLSFSFLNPDFFFHGYSIYHYYPFYLGPIIVFYGGLGAIVGLVQRTGTILEKFLIAIVLILFLALFYFANFMVFLNFSPGEF
jgi:hypothetical protein